MNLSLRIVLVTVYGYSLLTFLDWTHPGWFKEVKDECARLVVHQREAEKLQARMQVIRECQHAKQEIVTDLASGRLSLAEAARRFQNVNMRVADPVWWQQYHAVYQGSTAQERHGREVIALTQYMLKDQAPADLPTVTAQLEEQLEQMIDREELPIAN